MSEYILRASINYYFCYKHGAKKESKNNGEGGKKKNAKYYYRRLLFLEAALKATTAMVRGSRDFGRVAVAVAFVLWSPSTVDETA